MALLKTFHAPLLAPRPDFGPAHLQSHIKVVPFALLHPHAQLSFTLFPLECMKRSWQLLLLRCSDGSTLLSFLFFSLRVLHISSLWGCEGSGVTATLPFPSLVLRQDQQPLFEDAWGRVQLLKKQPDWCENVGHADAQPKVGGYFTHQYVNRFYIASLAE